MEIKSWIPLYSMKPINKDEFGNNPGFHPLVIFKTDSGYFYLACTSNIKNRKDFHVYVPKSIPKDKTKDYLFNRPSLVDTRRIFYMNKSDFEKCFDLDKNSTYQNSLEIEDKYKKEVLDKMLSNLRKEDFSFIECYLDKNNKERVLSKCIMIGKKSKNLLMGSVKYLENKKNISEKQKIINVRKWDNFFDEIIFHKNNKELLQINLNKIYEWLCISVNKERKRILNNINKHSSKEELDYWQ